MGEPPLFLAASVFYAIKEAVSAARVESELRGAFRLDSPASAERIRNACSDRFTQLVHTLSDLQTYIYLSVGSISRSHVEFEKTIARFVVSM